MHHPRASEQRLSLATVVENGAGMLTTKGVFCAGLSCGLARMSWSIKQPVRRRRKAEPDYRCCAAGIMHAARPREKEKEREREFGQRLIGAKGARAVDTTRRARQTGRAAWDDVDITIRLPNSNIASTGVGECCAARSSAWEIMGD